MEKRIIGLGIAGGFAAGLATFVFARWQLAPSIAEAVAYEEERSHAEAALTGAHGHEHEVFSRAVQENIGSAVGTVTFGVIMGALFAVALTLVMAAVARHRRQVNPAGVAAATAAAAFACVAVVPFLAYPANPPGVGLTETAADRTVTYLIVLAASVAAASAALAAGLRLTPRFGAAGATAASIGGYIAVMTAIVLVLPAFHEVPGPLLDNAGAVAFPGFPADLLADFRLSSLLGQALLWTTMGAVIAVLLPRVLAPARAGAAHAGR
ncbi:CbtA family protein [Mycolicibacterium sp. 018/SC-01/001]|uniref:CbtA family protein n=1 Tax=Mycolicibacterium sp. 018/SC-01/001 TaxID=2592069 RepID=UPI00117BE6ED|nr:CbtA family protein [Mycolicibacterium sp. 018/SC-01/001]TRW77265.1 CbtA family protein [Mycolicibacterium sp. 018/SC-01/001]